MTSEPQAAKALLLPADGSKIRIMDYDIKEKDEGDMVDSGMADFYDPIPPVLPTNKSCERIVGSPSQGQLFWRGNVRVIQYDYHLGLEHLYKDNEEVAIKAV